MGFIEQLDVSINGERVALLDISPTMTETDFGQNKGQNGMEVRTPPIHIKAGPQRISAAFIQRLEGPADDLLAPIENTAEGGDGYGTITLPHMRDLTIVGPIEGHRRVGDGEPQEDLQLPSDQRARRKRRAPRRSCAT